MPRGKAVKKESESLVSQVIKSDLLERFVPVLLVISIGLAFIVGILWQKVSDLESGKSVAGTETQAPNTAAPAPKIELSVIKDIFSKDVIKFGDADRKVLFVEIADPSCPYCHAAAGENRTIYQKLQNGQNFQLVADGGSYVAPVVEMKKMVDSGQASFAWIYYPGHGNGEMGTKAMYCANEQGKFWEVHDLLMSEAGYDEVNSVVLNDKTKSGEMANFLRSAIDPAFLKSCLDSGKYDARLAEDTKLAGTLNIGGTPGFFVNDVAYNGAYSFTSMQPTVDAALGN